jgi:hypothetical protein
MAVTPAHRPAARRAIGISAATLPKPNEECHDVADCNPIGQIEGLHIGREHLKPRPVIPQRKLDCFEVGAVDKAIDGEIVAAAALLRKINGVDVKTCRIVARRRVRA